MKLYNILVKKDQEEKVQDIILLKEGFLWKAFIFTGLWFLYHKMWREFFACIFINIVIAILAKFFYGFNEMFFGIALAILIAVNANFWRFDSLKKRGYEFVGSVFGDSQEEVIARFAQNIKNESDFNNFEEKNFLNSKFFKKITKFSKSLFA